MTKKQPIAANFHHRSASAAGWPTRRYWCSSQAVLTCSGDWRSVAAGVVR
ncbi:MAG: hypothetical protein ACJ8AI_18065 [Rhodopila sp.]